MLCAYHKAMKLTHFCPAPCLLPLCVQCLEQHEHHHSPDFTFQKLEDVYRAVVDDHCDLHNQLQKHCQTSRDQQEALVLLVTNFKARYASVRDQLLTSFDKQLKALETQLLDRLKGRVAQKMEVLQRLDRQAEQLLQTLEAGIMQLRQPRSAIKEIILFMKQDKAKNISSAAQRLKYELQGQQKIGVSLELDLDIQQQIQKLVGKAVSIQNLEKNKD